MTFSFVLGLSTQALPHLGCKMTAIIHNQNMITDKYKIYNPVQRPCYMQDILTEDGQVSLIHIEQFAFSAAVQTSWMVSSQTPNPSKDNLSFSYFCQRDRRR